ncbi:protein disulfide-isomerase a3 [Nannochloropsis oceanica]
MRGLPPPLPKSEREEVEDERKKRLAPISAQKPGGASPVKKFVGSNFLRRVAEDGKDVLVLNKPWKEGGGEGGREGGGVPIFVALSQPSPALQDLAEFLTTEGSFGTGLKMATLEQMGALAIDEEVIRARLEAEERSLLRNQIRQHYDLPLLDKLAGEVVFDGHRWQVWLGGLSLVMNAFFVLSWYLSSVAEAAKRKKKAKGRDGMKTE